MDTSIATGILLGLISGALLGSFALPSKGVRGWEWENTWLAYSAWGLVVLPWALAAATIPGLTGVLASTPRGALLRIFLAGAAWGLGSLGFGLSLKLLGFALGTAIVLGLNNAIGALLPIILFQPERLGEPAGRAISAGVVVMLVGIAICSLAGAQRDRGLGKTTAAGEARVPFARGLAIAVGAAVFAAMFNFAVVFSGPLEAAAREAGATPENAPNATWCVALLAGFLVTLAWCGVLLARHGTWARFASGDRMGRHHLAAFAMGLMWFGGVALYGRAVSMLGPLGASIGWPIIQSMAVASGNFWGIVTGEWKGVGRGALRTMLAGLVVLFAGIAVVGWASTLQAV